MEYVLLDVRRGDDKDRILVIRKRKPEWQKGRLNLVGGKIEEGESVLDASVRELKEETGLLAGEVNILGKITFNGGCVHCVSVKGVGECFTEINEGELYWKTFRDLKQDNSLIPNLKIIIPLMRMGVSGWEIEDNTDSVSGKIHKFSISI